jgi:hypothetical protein
MAPTRETIASQWPPVVQTAPILMRITREAIAADYR